MTREEAVEIKGEMLKKEGNLVLGNRTILDGLVKLNDMLAIIDKHISEKEKE